MRLTEHIFFVGSSRFGLSNPFDCSVYAIRISDGLALVDAGCGLQPDLIARNLRDDGLDPGAVRAIFVTHTHADHAGGCRWWKETTGCQIFVPQGERGVVEGTEDITELLETAKLAGLYPSDYRFPTVAVDQGVSDGDEIRIGEWTFVAIEVAGHSPHHTCYFARIDGQPVLFSGDAVLYGGTLLLQNIPGCSLEAYRRDIGKLADLEIDHLLPGHGIFVLRFGQEHVNRAVQALHDLPMPPNFAALCPKVIPREFLKVNRDGA